MRIAVVHDYFTQLGGAERVAAELVQAFPTARLFATVALDSRIPPELRGIRVHTSWMQGLPAMDKLYRLYFMLYPLGVAGLRLDGYDLILSSSSGYAKGVRAPLDSVHVCYCHTPMRWVWNFDGYSERERFPTPVRRVLSAAVSRLRDWDVRASREPDHFIANSRAVAMRIERAYGRSAEIIHPPIDIARFDFTSKSEDYYVVLSRLVPYKRLDIAVEACTRLGRKLLVIGSGSCQKTLEEKAGPTVEFLGRISDRAVAEVVGRCRALLFPGEEDFGMAPLEVAAAGRPTIAYRAGGAVESIVEGSTGLFFDEQSSDSLMQAILRFERQKWFPAELRSHATSFSPSVFHRRIRDFLAKVGIRIPRRDSISLGVPVSSTKSHTSLCSEGVRGG